MLASSVLWLCGHMIILYCHTWALSPLAFLHTLEVNPQPSKIGLAHMRLCVPEGGEGFVPLSRDQPYVYENTDSHQGLSDSFLPCLSKELAKCAIICYLRPFLQVVLPYLIADVPLNEPVYEITGYVPTFVMFVFLQDIFTLGKVSWKDVDYIKFSREDQARFNYFSTLNIE